MRKMVFVLVFSFCFLHIHISHAYLVWGVLNDDCGTYISQTKDDKLSTKNFYTSTFTGYITGRNYEKNSYKGKGLSPDSIYYAVKKYCRNNPLKMIDDAMIHIYDNELK